MQWEVNGADRETGADRALIIEADDEASAVRRGNRRGILVAAARPLAKEDSVVGTKVVLPTATPAAIPYRSSVVITPEEKLVKTARSKKKLQVALVGVVLLVLITGICTTVLNGRKKPGGNLISTAIGRSPVSADINSADIELITATSGFMLRDDKDTPSNYAAYHRRSSAEIVAAALEAEPSSPADQRPIMKADEALWASALKDLAMTGGDSEGFIISSNPVQYFQDKGKTYILLPSIASDTIYNTLKLEPKERAAKALSSLILRNLGTINRDLKASSVDGYAIIGAYGSEDFARERTWASGEAVMLLVKKADCTKFDASEITDQQLIDASEVYLYDTDGGCRRVAVQLK